MPPYGHDSYQPYSNATSYSPDARGISRTPSPSPSEIAALKQTSMFDIRGMFKREKLLSKQYFVYYLVAIFVIAIGLLVWLYDKQIVHAMQPAVTWMHNLSFGWLIPIAIFFVISFPPLFGHEILAIVVGLVWGVWAGFGITAAGTFLGEIGNFYAAKYLFQSYADKKEKSNIQYACLSRLIRDGGFKVALIVRYSAVPGHFTTAIFALCGMNIFVFMAAALLSLPKQFITVYIGTLLEENANGTTNTRDKILSYVVAFVTGIVTIAAMWYIHKGVNRVKPDVIYARRKARQAKLNGSGSFYGNASAAETTDDAIFNPEASDTALVTSDTPYDPPYQKWDKHGRAAGYTSDSRVYAPQPRRANETFDVGLATSVGSTTPTGQTGKRQESSDSVGWDLQTAAADSQSYPLQTLPETEPIGPLKNPFESNESPETTLPPSSPPSGPSRGKSNAGYAFSSRQHSFGGTTGDPRPDTSRVKSPPPYQE
ncbi:snare associated Golgi protein-domain-containing protein [Scleroderma yunnanense]